MPHLDFPTSPTVGQKYSVAGSATYTWDGEKWVSSGIIAGKQYVFTDGSAAMTGQLTLVTPPVATTDAASKAYVDSTSTAAAAGKVNRAGDSMTGNLGIVKNNPALVLVKDVSGSDAFIVGQLGPNNRWLMQMANATAEGGGNSGSDFVIHRYTDAGTYIGPAFSMQRSSGAVTQGNTTFSSFAAPTTGRLDFGNTGTKYLSYDATNFIFNGASLVVSGGSLYSAATATTGSLNFGTSGAKTLSYDGTNFALVGGTNFFVAGDVSAYRAANVNTGAYYFGNALAKYLFYDATDFRLAGGHLFVTTGNVVSWAASGASNPNLVLANETGASKGLYYWERSTNAIVIANVQSGVSAALLNGGQWQAGIGIMNRAGMSGGYGTNNFNLMYNGAGATALWIDATSFGNINVTSDYRVKKDVLPLHTMWDTVKALRPIKYTHAEFSTPSHVEMIEKQKADLLKGRAEEPTFQLEVDESPLVAEDDIERWGFIAHELQGTLTPSAASGEKDAPDAIQAPNPFTVIAALTKALQEAMARIEALEAA
jgi:hypothetical protein